MCKAPSTELPSRRPDAHAVTPRPAAEQAAKYYLKVMDKAAADGGFISKETARLQKMIDDGSVKPAKKEQFGRRLNVLSSFA